MLSTGKISSLKKSITTEHKGQFISLTLKLYSGAEVKNLFRVNSQKPLKQYIGTMVKMYNHNTKKYEAVDLSKVVVSKIGGNEIEW